MRLRILVLGCGDVGSAVAHGLYCNGARVLLSDRARPVHSRRGMSFIDALFDGEATLEGVTGRHATSLQAIRACWDAGDAIPVASLPEADLVQALAFDVVVDATMRRSSLAPDRRALAPVVIGLGPGFTPGVNCHIAVETQWGESMGAVLRERGTASLAGGPPFLDGVGRERFVMTGAAGKWRTQFAIGQRVAAGDVVGTVDGNPLRAPLSGTLRGLAHDDVAVVAGDSLFEVDPREAPEVFGLGPRPRAVARGVCAALGGNRSERWSSAAK
jgi:xanthine dehydrogenase accessory factor